ncbi:MULTISPECIES: bifunctional isocitrate dehydrogenase kinase/phosphatase [Cupriavidus]|uniref:Isocitrate dehydrogenase kinase/phosphatase n=1 Tax=Cupriavidus taiwanensis TaxID=164546 RepID=A0A375CUC3_9BURK|nr:MULTISPECIES: bifunctional isocitrate dehydrogenase kinase/phosphatase [Cupriavidus]MEC3767150.1 bifunctional isocitrate dehydrogenase kinase/phosphatase [Cupriavidus sp. SS-3]SOY78826.1 isocitrate dehydrogenase kinase/phosphatase [Cupriavidus taiwanensis]SOY80612.1 isocitrate dehydrogenase kinase/phosphatase [Cupriavidus taiwanensis]SPA47662.1 isocitrate dehydrogenase kinase/phosphatase [Cupriavidus taiwanensis]SPD63128.1 Isocitrate dehydrogenase kinase/phosphatase [Cupriavidus taiwanensis
MSHFPKLLSSQIAYDVARTMLDGFDKHYRLFREVSHQAKLKFEAGDWHGLQQIQRDRIAFYNERVRESSVILEDEYDAENIEDEIWQQIKLHYIGLLTNHHQPELAETFFNSVCTRILHRSYFNNDFIFVRPAISTEYIENEESPTRPTFRAYYPGSRDGMAACFERIVHNFQLERPFEDLQRDIGYVVRAVGEHFGDFRIAPNFQIHTLSSLFFRNKSAFIIGRILNGDRTFPLAIPIVHGPSGKLVLDTVLLKKEQLLILFSFTHSYFMVDMEIPSAYVTFLRDIMPRKPRAEIYTSLGLQKQGKNLFYRDFLHHLQHSSDKFIVAPGIRGLVMLVFTLPSYPYVFKVIRDFFPAPKETTRELVKSKYQLVKQHDRVGRMADTLEYSDVAFPLSRFDDALVREFEQHAPSMIEYQRAKDGGEEIVVRHVYIERRMTPLNIYLQEGSDAQVEHGVIEYGNAIKELIAANIFPGDMLYKNFGVTRHGRVVFYDYDEIEYLTDCNIRHVPQPRNEEEEMSGEVWYTVRPHDIFPETFRTFLLGDARVGAAFLRHHADFFDPAMWQSHKDRLLAGHVHDFFAYHPAERFINRYGAVPELPAADPARRVA